MDEFKNIYKYFTEYLAESALSRICDIGGRDGFPDLS